MLASRNKPAAFFGRVLGVSRVWGFKGFRGLGFSRFTRVFPEALKRILEGFCADCRIQGLRRSWRDLDVTVEKGPTQGFTMGFCFGRYS